MKKNVITLILCALCFVSLQAQKSVYVYRNDGNTTPDIFERAVQLNCADLTTQEIVTEDNTVHQVPLEAIDSIRFGEPIPASFPRKHLIEEFTGQGCGYCPYGMDCISEFMKDDPNFILLLHHSGYSSDHFTMAGSNTITSQLGVDGAPSVTIDRKATRTSGSNTIVFHPGYLPGTSKTQFAKETYASVCIDNQYNPETRKLTVTVSGALCKADYPALSLTVVIKESGMIDTQSDYYETFEGWSEFRHCNAVRAFLTNAKGNAVTVDETRHYKAVYTTTLNAKWVPENCMVVAFLGESFKPIIQVEEAPVVAGTTGGADLEHGGITKVPVSDYYPEPNATKGPKDYSGNDEEVLTYSAAWYESNANYTFWSLMSYNSSVTVKVNNINCVPFTYIYFFTEPGVTTIQPGTYEFNTSELPGSAYAGYRDDEQSQLGGSEFYFTNKSYFNQGYLVPKAEWLIVDGTLTITETGWTVTGHARNGSEINLRGKGTIVNNGRAQAPKRQKKQ